MAGLRTPDLPGWDLVPPSIHPARTLGLEIRADIPLFADMRTYICGLAIGVVSAQFLHFFSLSSTAAFGSVGASGLVDGGHETISPPISEEGSTQGPRL